MAITLTSPACSSLQDAADQATEPAVTTGPPPGASQPPGPPLATATATPAGPVEPTDPASVAADCYVRWQSYDATEDEGPTAGAERARNCLTDDFAAQLLGAPGSAAGNTGVAGDTGVAGEDADARAKVWEQLVSARARSTVEVLGTHPAGGVDTSAAGRVVLVLNVRRITEEDGTQPVTTVSTPALTLLRQPDGTWRVGGADLSHAAGDSPGR